MVYYNILGIFIIRGWGGLLLGGGDYSLSKESAVLCCLVRKHSAAALGENLLLLVADAHVI